VKAERTEGLVQVLILIAVAGMAGAASFTHVHDWTMRNVPPGTSSWLGWANAVITELVPAAAGIETRRRKRQHRPVTYPVTILIADAAISVAVQLSDAIHTLAGGVAFALPVLAFLALTKLLLSRARTITTKEDPQCAQPASEKDAPKPPQAPSPRASAPATATSSIPSIKIPDGGSSPSAPVLTASSEPKSGSSGIQSDLAPVRGVSALEPVSSGQLLISARMTAFAHRQATGQPITAAELASRLSVPLALAESLLDHIDGTPPPVTAVNGTVMNGSRP
jgi:hypothetical protein